MIVDLPFHVVSISVLSMSLWFAARRRRHALHGLVLGAAISGLAAVLMGHNVFHCMRLASWLMFVHGPLFLVVVAFRERASRSTSAVALAAAAALVLVAFDAFFVEPSRLQQTRYSVAVPGLRDRVRIVVLADIQSEKVGAYERSVFEAVARLEPDLVLLLGDFLHVFDETRPAQVRQLRELLRGLTPRLGTWAVRGNIDPPNAAEIFRGTAVRYVEKSQSMRITEDIDLLALSLHDSFDSEFRLPVSEAPLRIVMGHAPDYALGSSMGASLDLNLAGHTHGGQVRLPLLGPLVSLSRVPRSWAGGGMNEIGERRKLVVSRGIGMERGLAPRLRFLCPPEIVAIDVEPAGTSDP